MINTEPDLIINMGDNFRVSRWKNYTLIIVKEATSKNKHTKEKVYKAEVGLFWFQLFQWQNEKQTNKKWLNLLITWGN